MRDLIDDRDPLYTQQFLNMLGEAGIESVKLPSRAPNLNAYAKRFVRTIKEGCLDQTIFFGEELRQAIVDQYGDASVGAQDLFDPGEIRPVVQLGDRPRPLLVSS